MWGTRTAEGRHLEPQGALPKVRHGPDAYFEYIPLSNPLTSLSIGAAKRLADANERTHRNRPPSFDLLPVAGREPHLSPWLLLIACRVRRDGQNTSLD
jgi:hypothetical protein